MDSTSELSECGVERRDGLKTAGRGRGDEGRSHVFKKDGGGGSQGTVVGRLGAGIGWRGECTRLF